MENQQQNLTEEQLLQMAEKAYEEAKKDIPDPAVAEEESDSVPQMLAKEETAVSDEIPDQKNEQLQAPLKKTVSVATGGTVIGIAAGLIVGGALGFVLGAVPACLTLGILLGVIVGLLLDLQKDKKALIPKDEVPQEAPSIILMEEEEVKEE